MVLLDTDKKFPKPEPPLIGVVWATYVDLCEDDPTLKPSNIALIQRPDMFSGAILEIEFLEIFQVVEPGERKFTVVLDIDDVKNATQSADSFVDYLTQQLKQKRREEK